jgi:hypothetical protein
VHEDQPAEQKTMATAPHGGHAAKHQRHNSHSAPFFWGSAGFSRNALTPN